MLQSAFRYLGKLLSKMHSLVNDARENDRKIEWSSVHEFNELLRTRYDQFIGTDDMPYSTARIVFESDVIAWFAFLNLCVDKDMFEKLIQHEPVNRIEKIVERKE